ncbi:actin cytoskeleton-regulatory complex protein PAN1-like [Ooceraea biroi]|uniref:actin cytoskeleton-regulatory complex protein PAN1-like n=1 Tax=Ooceraea biroi TaxID=2015173 RepID=UPI000F0809B3|nr:actin cytoskeleton-regulatory complex protein PAN1-like [Ooceraea biroi]
MDNASFSGKTGGKTGAEAPEGVDEEAWESPREVVVVSDVEEGVSLRAILDPAAASSSAADGSRGGTRRPRTRQTARRGGSSARSGSRAGRVSRDSSRDSAASTTCDVASLPGDVDTDASASETGRKRKRGRPPTTGEYVGLAEAKRAAREEERLSREWEREKEVLASIPSPADKRERESWEVQVERFRECPSPDITARVMEHLETVVKVAKNSGHLQGPYVRALKEAAAGIRAALTVTAERRGAGAPSLSTENAALRGEVESLKSQVRELRDTISLMGRATAGDGGESQRVADSPVLRVRGRRLVTPPRSPATSEAGLRTETTPQKGGGPPAEREDPLVAMEARIMASMGTMVSRIVAEAVAPLVRRGAREGAEPTPQTGPEEPGNGGTAKKKKKGKKGGGGASGAPPALNPPPAEQRPSSAVAGPASRVPAGEEEQPWSTVVGRRAARPTAQPPAPAGKGKPVPGKPAPGRGASGGGKPATGKPSPPGGRPGAKGPKPPKSPKTAAVVITAADGDYKGAVEKAQKGVDIDALGIAAPRVRRALTGALIYEIPGPESATKADELASRLEKVFEGSGVRVTRPLKKAELRVRRLDDAATAESVARAVAAAGGCDPRDIEVGLIQRSPDGLGTSWIRLPAQAGGKVADLGRIRVGWAWAPITVLEPRPLMCYRCLAKGHVQATCPSREDRRDLCYRCGAAGHRARGCAADPKCPLCTGLGRRADHRLGSAACAPPSKGGKSGVQRGSETAAQGGAWPTEAAPRPQRVTSPAPRQAAPSAGAALEPTPADGDKGGPAPPREEEPKPRRVTRSMGKKKAEEKDDDGARGLEEPAMDVE